MRASLFSLVVLSLLFLPVLAKPQTTATDILAENWLMSHLFAYVRLRSGMKIDKAHQFIKNKFQRMDIDGDGISASDYKLHRQIQRARARARTIRDWAMHDLDGDGLVTRKEYSVFLARRVPRTLNFGGETVETTAAQRTQLTQKAVDKKMRADLDGSGAVSMQEAIAEGKKKRAPLRFLQKSQRPPEIPEVFDKDQDGAIRFEEFSTIAKRVLKQLDLDHDGKLSQSEVRNYWLLRRKAKKNMPL